MNPSSEERGPSSPPAVTAVVVSYNSARDLPACLTSLEGQRGVSLEIHVVDNASSDGSAELVRRDFPRVRLTANSTNVGFARANNQVLGTGTPEFYALVNPDTILPPDALAACVDCLRTSPSAGVAATRLVTPDGALQPSCHSFPGLTNLLGETLGLDRLLPWLRPLASLHMPWFRHDRVLAVDWIQGAFLVVRADVVRAVGPFDPEFFMYGEEMDWCRRIRDAGWSVVFLPDPPVVHAGGGSSDPVAGPMFVENLKGRVRFMTKHRGGAVAAAARAIIALSVVLRFLWSEVRMLALRLIGRAPGAPLCRNQERFRGAIRWVLAGMPVAPRIPGRLELRCF
jgi:GT2 family glycosyltransferase